MFTSAGARALLLFSFVFAFTAFAQPADLILVNGKIVNPKTQTVTGAHLWLRAGKIHKVVRVVPPEYSGAVMDIAGQWVIPGLIDMHVHSYGNLGPTDTAFQYMGTE